MGGGGGSAATLSFFGVVVIMYMCVKRGCGRLVIPYTLHAAMEYSEEGFIIEPAMCRNHTKTIL